MSVIFKKGKSYTLLMSSKENSAVKIAAANLQKDFAAVLQADLQIVDEKDVSVFKAEMMRDYDIVLGTIGESKIIDSIVAKNMLTLWGVRDENDKMRKEGYVLAEQESTLVIAGTDRRGTVFGIYELSRQMGVSPWYFFADVPIKKKDEFVIAKNYHKSDYPSVEYRGIFINDEEELEVWSKKHTSDDTIGPETYKHIFELLLRLKANFIWPAMHVNSFNVNVENGRLADSMGVVVGTSHCDMLMRSNNCEWNQWVEKKGYEGLKYDFTIPGENRERLIEYWQESVEQNKDFEVCYTVGMRGIHDSGFVTERIDKKDISKEEKQREKVKLLENIIEIQRSIINCTLGDDKRKKTLQSFVPYKEVLSLYDNGLRLPENITTIWADDNFGYMRRYPSAEERKRSGGHGLYYHASYWAHPGMSYLFFNSIPLAHIHNELRKSYESGIRKMWVLNVGALKPIEQEMDFFVNYAWNVGKENTITDVKEYLEEWANYTFSGGFGREIADICIKFTRIANVRKVEHMRFDVFSQTAYGDEAVRRLNELKRLVKRANAIYAELPEEEKAAFFELILMKIQAAFYIYTSFYCADRSNLCFEQGKLQAADMYYKKAYKFDSYKRRLIEYYNKKLVDGKWDGILTPESYPPPRTALFPPSRPALRIEGEPEMKVFLWKGADTTEENELVFSKYGLKLKWFEIANLGKGSFRYEVEAPEWLELSEKAGTITEEKRILVKVSDIGEHQGESGTITIKNLDDGKCFEITVKVEEEHYTKDVQGYLEADGYISIPCSKYDFNWNNGKGEYNVISHLGRHEGSMLEADTADLEALEGEVSENPYVEYIFNNYTEGSFEVEFYRFMTLNSKGRIRFAVSVDGSEPDIIESPINDEWKGSWRDSVMDDVDKVMYTLPFLNAGEHRLCIYMIDNYVAFSKVVIYTKGFVKSNLGPQRSKHTLFNFDRKGEEKPNEAISFEEEYFDRICDEVYSVSAEELGNRNTYYAALKQWRGSLANSMIVKELPIAGAKKDYLNVHNEKDIQASFGTGAFIEKDGKLALEAECVLEQSEYAFTKAGSQPESVWIHSNAETCAQTGLAMYVREKGSRWTVPTDAPSLNYKIKVNNTGKYCVWMLIKFDTLTKGTCFIGVDDYIQPLEEQYMKGSVFAYCAEQVWRWTPITELDITEGEHTLSIYAAASDFRIDRIYLTTSEELPPDDFAWEDSFRK